MIQFHFTTAVTEKPAARVMGLIHCDPVNPRFQTALAAETADVAEDLEKDLLDYVARFALIIQQAQRKSVYRLLEPCDQVFVRAFRALAEGLH